jgi:hypothetical protein
VSVVTADYFSRVNEKMDDYYKHKALSGQQYIRVVDFLPANHIEADLECNLLEINLAHPGLSESKVRMYPSLAKLRFEAISYCWGNHAAQPEHYILCDGKKLSITGNAAAVLKRLRLATETRRVWIDSICIDQSSTTERNQQVALMGQIYSRARRVITWLGESDWSTGYAYRYLQELGTKYPQNHLRGEENVAELAVRIRTEIAKGSAMITV